MNDFKDFSVSREEWQLKTSYPAKRPLMTILKIVFALIILTCGGSTYYWVREWGEFSKDALRLTIKDQTSSLNKKELQYFLQIAHTLRKDDLIQKLYHQLLDLDPENSETLINMARFYSQHEQYEYALPFYEGYQKKNIMTADVCFFYGKALSAVGKDEEALHWHYKSMEMSDRYIDNFEELLKLLLKINKPYEGLSLIHYYNTKYPHYVTYLGAYKVQFSEMAFKIGNQQSFRVPELNKHYHIAVKFSLLKEPVMYLVDTGASVLTIPRELYNKKIDSALPTGQKVALENADKVRKMADRIFLSEIKIGSIVLKHVEAVICDNCSLLLGQSVLNRMQISTDHQDGKNFLIVKSVQ